MGPPHHKSGPASRPPPIPRTDHPPGRPQTRRAPNEGKQLPRSGSSTRTCTATISRRRSRARQTTSPPPPANTPRTTRSGNRDAKLPAQPSATVGPPSSAWNPSTSYARSSQPCSPKRTGRRIRSLLASLDVEAERNERRSEFRERFVARHLQSLARVELRGGIRERLHDSSNPARRSVACRSVGSGNRARGTAAFVTAARGQSPQLALQGAA